MQDTLANDWRQRMAGRSAVCAVLLAVPVAVAAQISFSAGLDNLPFGVSTLAGGPDAIAPARSTPPAQNLTTLLDDAGAPALAGGGGGDAAGTDPGATTDVSGGPGAVLPTGTGGGPTDTGGPGGPGPGTPTPPTPEPPTGGPVPTPPAPEPPAPAPVPSVPVPDTGGVVDDAVGTVEGATGLQVPGVGGN